MSRGIIINFVAIRNASRGSSRNSEI